jgi:hypothetical protein
MMLGTAKQAGTAALTFDQSCALVYTSSSNRNARLGFATCASLQA